MNPLIRAAALAGYEQQASEAGLSPATRLRRVGLSLDDLREPDRLIPYPAMIELLEQSAQASGWPDFGLQLSQRQGLEILGPIAVIAENAPDVAQAFALAGRYMFVQSPAIRVTLQPVGSAAGDWVDVCFDIDIEPRPACVQAVELALGVMVRCAHLLGQGEFAPHEVLLPHARAPGSTRHEQLLGAPCRFNQPQAAVRLQAKDMQRPLHRSNPMLREMAQRYIDTQFIEPSKPFSDRVRQVVQRLLGTEQASHQSVSQVLSMHPRTMQRRLVEEGTTFEKIKDEVRRSVVENMMRNPDPPSLSTLMAMLDYADASTLTRSCRRWFGVPPTALRTVIHQRTGITDPADARSARPADSGASARWRVQGEQGGVTPLVFRAHSHRAFPDLVAKRKRSVVFRQHGPSHGGDHRMRGVKPAQVTIGNKGGSKMNKIFAARSRTDERPSFLRRSTALMAGLLIAAAGTWSQHVNAAETQQPNILVIMADDIGIWNLSAYSRGSMGYRSPNIDSIAREGTIFTDHYGQPSCTAGRAAFITGQMPIRTGLTAVGFVGAKQGIQATDATLAEVLKTQGYATGQFGKNHLGDRNEYLPTRHGFDEFFGNLYHLNTEEEPEDPDYPTDPEFKKRNGPRGVLHCTARRDDNPATPTDPRFGAWGPQDCQDTGPLTRKRMETVDGEFIEASTKFMAKAKADKKPFFVWLNTTRMHVFTHAPQDYLKRCRAFTSATDSHCAGMLQHDEEVGGLLDKLKKMGLDQNTIVVYISDNGPEHSTWPHGGTTPYRSEKMTTWEGGVRVPMLVRWPGHIQPGSELNGIQSHEDVFTTLAAAAGAPDIKERLAKGDALGTSVVKKSFLDGVNNVDYWTGKSPESARRAHLYYEESTLRAVRINQWKVTFGSRENYYGTSVTYPMPVVQNLRQDPFESYLQAPGPRADMTQSKTYLFNTVLEQLNAHVGSLKAFPPSQKSASLDVNKVIENMVSAGGAKP